MYKIILQKILAAKVFSTLVALPTLLSIIYFGLIASDIYVTEARYAVKSNTPSTTTGMTPSIFTPDVTSSLVEDSLIVRDFVLSRDMLAELEDELSLKAHYQSSEIDFVARLSNDVTFEEFFDYYQDMVEIEVNSSSSVSTLKVRAFTPEFSEAVAALIIEKSEKLVNNMTQRIVDDALQFARDEVNVAEKLLRDASDELALFRSQSRSINPAEETSAVLGIVTQLESNLAQARAELIQTKSFMRPDSTLVSNLQAKVNALEEQVKRERERMSAEDDKESDFTKLIYAYEPLELNKRLAEQQFASALTSLESARAGVQHKQRYLVPFVKPKVPDQAIEPERLTAVFTVYFATLLIYAIAKLIWAAVKDHLRN